MAADALNITLEFTVLAESFPAKAVHETKKDLLLEVLPFSPQVPELRRRQGLGDPSAHQTYRRRVSEQKPCLKTILAIRHRKESPDTDGARRRPRFRNITDSKAYLQTSLGAAIVFLQIRLERS